MVRRVTQSGRVVQSGSRFMPGCGQEGKKMERPPGVEDWSSYTAPNCFWFCNFLICRLTLINSKYLFFFGHQFGTGHLNLQDELTGNSSGKALFVPLLSF